LAAAHILYEIKNLLSTNLAMRATYCKVLSKHKTFAAHFSLFSSTQFAKHWARAWCPKILPTSGSLEKNTDDLLKTVWIKL